MDPMAAAADDAFNRAMDEADEIPMEELEAAGAIWDRLVAEAR